MIFKIFKKELKDTLRDRRTLMMMLVIPVLVFPIILNVFVGISAAFTEDAITKELKVGYFGPHDNYFIERFDHLPAELGNKKVVYYSDSTQMFKDLRDDSLQLAFIIPQDFDDNLKSKVLTDLSVYYDATEIGMEERAENYVDAVLNIAQQERYIDLQLNAEQLTPFTANYSNIASSEEMLGKLAGGFLPYIFIAFGFLGCMYPAIDLFTGEKERGTIETLLTTPVARWQILFGKMGVVVLSGLLASSAALAGLFLSIEVFDMIEDPQILEIIHGILSAEFVLMLFGLLFPLTVFFAGVMIPIAVYAKSFKEAQSIITPLNIVMVLPAMIGFFPGIELNLTTAAIPVVNIVLATKELIAGTLEPSLLFISFGVMTLLAVGAVFVSYKRFDKEGNIIL